MKLFVASLIICLSVCAQDLPQPNPSASPPVAPGSQSAVDGQVLDAATGKYYLYTRPARKPGSQERVDERKLEFPGAFYPGTPDITAAQAIQASPGIDLRDMNFAVEKTRTSSIRGRLVNPLSEHTDCMLMVSLQPENSVFPPEIVHANIKTGAFEFSGILPGSYTLAAQWFEGDDRYTARQSVTVGESDVEGLNLAMEKGAQLTGAVRVQ